MQSATTPKEAKMFSKHLTRLVVMVVSASILVAMYADIASAGFKMG